MKECRTLNDVSNICFVDIGRICVEHKMHRKSNKGRFLPNPSTIPPSGDQNEY